MQEKYPTRKLKELNKMVNLCLKVDLHVPSGQQLNDICTIAYFDFFYQKDHLSIDLTSRTILRFELATINTYGH